MKKVIIKFSAILMMVLFLTNGICVFASTDENIEVEAKSAILMEVSSGKIIYEKN